MMIKDDLNHSQQKSRIKKIIKYLRIFLVVSFINVVISVISFGFIGNWLHVEREPINSDAIVILAGDPSRALYAADLFLEGYAPKVYISRAIQPPSSALLKDLGIHIPPEEELYRHILKIKGVPDEAVFFFGDSSISTAEEAQSLKPILGLTKRNILVVTSRFHVRRSQMIFNDILKSEILVIGSPYNFHSKRWWENKYSAVAVINETIKILFYKLGFHFDSESVHKKNSAVN